MFAPHVIKQRECVRTSYIFWLFDVIVSFVIKHYIIFSDAHDFVVIVVNNIEKIVTLISIPLKGITTIYMHSFFAIFYWHGFSQPVCMFSFAI